MESDIQFGDMEEARPEQRPRPDQNKHFAVVACHDPCDGDLKIYVDLDVMRDMESHALSDTRVELGGVLLGGQFEDEHGEPFVWVTDSLRAEHYEATKGSFKFTHETWEQISRQRDEFPAELQMVGWYHTHPDWGVFLSGMDLFICQNFFNRKLDLALVIDPCRGDRGWFQWDDDSDQPRRTGGYYLTASRFRRAEIEQFALSSRGKIPMSPDPRYASVAGQIGPQTTYVPMAPPRQPILEIGILALIGLQMTLVVLLAWQMVRPATAEQDQDEAVSQQVAAMMDRLDRIQVSHDAELTVQTQQQLLRDLMSQRGSSGAIADRLTEIASERDRFRAAFDAQQIAQQVVTEQLDASDAEMQRLADDATSYRAELEAVSKKNSDLQEKLTSTETERDEALTQAKGSYRWYRDWLYLVVLGGVCLLSVMGGMAAATYLRRDNDEDGGDEDGGDEAALPPAMTYSTETSFPEEGNDDPSRS